MAKVKFTKDIIGSPNGIIVNEYKEGQVVSDAELGNYLLEVWKEAGIIEYAEGEADTDAETDNKPNDEDEDNEDELTDEKIGELVYEAIEILEKDGKLTEEEIAKLKEIGIELKIEGMQTSKKPQTIVDKINKYIDEYQENEADTDADVEGEEIPEAEV